MTELFAIICHGMWKQLYLLHSPPATTGLTAASCYIYGCPPPGCISVACTLPRVDPFLFSFLFYPPTASDIWNRKIRDTLKTERRSEVYLDASAKVPDSDLQNTCSSVPGPPLNRLPVIPYCGRMKMFV